MTRTSVAALSLVALTVAACGGDSLPGGGGSPPDMSPDFALPPTADPGVVSKSSHTNVEAETHVVAAPNRFVALAWIGVNTSGFSTNGYVFSKDDGATFEPVDSIGSPNGEVSSDPVLAADAKSNIYMTWIGFKRQGGNGATDMHVYAAVAPAGTTRFGAPVEVSAPDGPGDQFDKPWIAVTHDGAVLVTYARTSSGGIFAARSTDMKSFTNATIAEDGGFRNLVYPCLPSSGARVYATYHAGGGIGLRWSDDHGATWPDANKTAVADPKAPTPAFDDPTCAAEGDEVWVSYGLSGMGFSTSDSALLDKVLVAHSADGGKTIDRRASGTDDAGGALSLHPYLVREATTGALDLVYYAGAKQNDPAGSLRRTRSTDGGVTWAPSVSIHDGVTFLGSRASAKWLGDYIGVEWARGSLYVSYANNASAVAHVSFYRTRVP